MSEELLIKVEQINVLLRAFGQIAVQEIKMMKDGKVVGQIRYGYRPQYVFDAVNYVIRPENWRYEIVSKEIFDYQAVVEVKLFLRVKDEEWLCKGSQTGQMNIINKNVGDAYKGAVTDALQKCFSLLSVGCDAYRGLLKGVYEGRQSSKAFNTYPQAFLNNKPPQDRVPQLPPVDTPQLPEPQKPPQPEPNTQRTPPKQNQTPAPPKPEVPQVPAAPEPPLSEQSSNDELLPPGLPEFAGITWEVQDGRVVTVGNTYNYKNNIRAMGFKFDGTGKYWYKNLADFQQVA